MTVSRLTLRRVFRSDHLRCGAATAVKASGQGLDFDSDEELEAALRRELVEIARLNGVSEPEALRDILLSNVATSASR